LSIIDTGTGNIARTIPGREASWTKGGIVVLTNGTVRTGDRARDAQVLEIWSGAQKKELFAISKLVADARVQAPAQPRGLTQTTGLTAAPDGAHVGIHVNFLASSPTVTFSLVRARDGVATAVIVGETVGDEAWSATGRYIGYTLTIAQGGSASRQRAIVRDAETGDVVIEHDGRFAGWSPDGLWTYIARSDGLYARKLSGGDPVRFALYGVPVSAAQP
jgi:hypothetical protein